MCISIYEYIHLSFIIGFMVSIVYIPLSNISKRFSLLLSSIRRYRVLTKVYYTSDTVLYLSLYSLLCRESRNVWTKCAWRPSVGERETPPPLPSLLLKQLYHRRYRNSYHYKYY